MEIIPTALPQELKDKYDIVNDTFIRKDKGEVAEEREVEIGDVHSDEFQPQVKLKQWDNETNFSVRLIDDDPTKPEIKTEGNKIKFIKKDRECHFYNVPKTDKMPKCFEFEVLLKKKPKTNRTEMSIETKGLKFYRQPPLTEEFQSGYSEEFKKEIVVTETDVKDSEGNILVHRPIEIVNGFAVYHESKAGDYSKMEVKTGKWIPYDPENDFAMYAPGHEPRIDGINYKLDKDRNWLQAETKLVDSGLKNYRAGKVMHIPFPYLIDANGWKVRAESFDIDTENNLLTVVAPQEFLDNAVYPIRHAAGLTFGYTTAGSSYQSFDENHFYGSLFTSPADANEAVSMSFFSVDDGMGPYDANLKALIVLHSNLNIIANGITPGFSILTSGSPGLWKTGTFSTSPSLSASTEYVLGFISDNWDANYAWDSGDTNQGHYDGSNSYSSPTNPTDATHSTNKYSIYCTYTAGGAAQKEVTDVGSGADAVSVKCQTTVTESGAGADIAAVLASMNLTDTGSGADTISITQLKSLLETGSGADIISLIAKLNVVDTGAGSEVISLLGQIAQTDTGAGSEALSILSKLATITDSGSGADALTVLVKIALTDTGAGAEALSILYKIATIDTGAGSEIISILNQFILTDTGTGADVIDKTDLGSEKLVNDSGTGSEALSILTQLAVTDLGTGAEAVNALIKLSVLDNGTGSEIVSLLSQIAQTDTGSGSEALEILKQIAVTETGTASEAITALVQLAVSETASGADVASVSGNIKEIVDTGVGSEALSILVEMSITDSGTGIEILSVLNQIAQTDTGSGADVIDKTALDTKDITDSGSGADVVAFAKQLVLQDSGVGADTIAKQKIVAAVATILSALDKNANIKSTGQNLKSNIKLTEQTKAKIKSIINN